MLKASLDVRFVYATLLKNGFGPEQYLAALPKRTVPEASQAVSRRHCLVRARG